MQLKFCCPECGDTRLEEIMDRAHVSTEIQGVSPDTGELWYGEVEVSDGVVLRYQCKGCGYHLATNGAPIDTEEELRDWLLDNVWVVYRELEIAGVHHPDIVEVVDSSDWTRSHWAFAPYSEPKCFSVASDKEGYAITQRQFLEILEEKGYPGQ
jgi:hypothetical protein